MPGSLAVATIVTCAIFATATGIVGAVVTLMGLLAFPAMLKAGYNVKVSAGAVTAGGCLGILIPPSVLLIVYGATAGVSVVQLYAGAFFPGIMLAGLYLGYVIVLAKLKPALMPPLAESEQRVPLPPYAQALAQRGRNALAGLLARAYGARRRRRAEAHGRSGSSSSRCCRRSPSSRCWASCYRSATAPEVEASTAGLVEAGGAGGRRRARGSDRSVDRNRSRRARRRQEEPAERRSAAATPAPPPAARSRPQPAPRRRREAAGRARRSACRCRPGSGSCSRSASPRIALIYWLWTWERLEVFKMLLASFFPLALLILAVLGSIVFGLATPAEAAAVGAFGGFLLAAAYRFIAHLQAAQGGRLPAPSSARTLREFGHDPQGVVVPHRQDERDGVLAVRRLRRSSRRRSRCSAARS